MKPVKMLAGVSLLAAVVIAVWFIISSIGVPKPAALPLDTALPPTATPLPPTETPTPRILEAEDVGAEFLVTFDGEGCILSGPPEVPVGDYRFAWKNLAEQQVGFWFRHFTGGHTFQELVDMQPEPGVAFPRQSWVASVISTVEWDAANEVYIYTYSLDTEGEYGAVVGSTDPRADPALLYFCGPVMVTEAPSE